MNIKMDRHDLRSIALVIDQALRDWIARHPTNKDGTFEEATQYAIGVVMHEVGGLFDPGVVRSLVLMHRCVWEGTGHLVPC